ncbi:glutathione S-transferase family protein [Albimonas sp. CAU 1670]|uniref:glutathione S-transferase family protein n=1 Tax=Albimonas sp. CAU 1670 TaxID=3032599 RepID=UPI0023DC13C9|nr:glutathione S-transferase family protein [Albimonas sp. CAU 1670]MDF2231113.1 glutathione S-transferase family protein [Albimonas sp. CAU 1670]
MKRLVEGEWTTAELTGGDGSFQRSESSFRNWVTADGAPGPSGEGGFKAESGRYHLYVSLACPWAHRTLILREAKGLAEHIGVSVVHPDMLDDGWTFDESFPGATGDTLMGKRFLREIYLEADPGATTRVTVPVLWDKERGTIVSNESAEIIRMFDQAFDAVAGPSERLWPEDLREAIEPVNARIYDTLNNGVYKAGFATTQEAYEAAVRPLFETMDWLEARLGRSRWLMGDRLTEADWRLYTTLARFDAVYFGHFKCNIRRLCDMPALWAYARELYQRPEARSTTDFAHIKRHYHYSHESINPHRIVPLGPELDWDAPHGRERLAAA